MTPGPLAAMPPLPVCVPGGLEILHALGDVLQVLELGGHAHARELVHRLRERVSLCRSGCTGCQRPARVGVLLDVAG